MSDASQGGKPGRIESLIKTETIITIGTLLIGIAVAWGSLVSDSRALAQRIDKNEHTADKAADVLDAVKGSIIRIETEQKSVRADAERMGRQLDRIETLLRSGGTPPAPPKP